jgi:hypothetical protein
MDRWTKSTWPAHGSTTPSLNWNCLIQDERPRLECEEVHFLGRMLRDDRPGFYEGAI